MSNEIEAVTESAKAAQEVAKTAGKALDLAEAGGGYLAWMLGTTPQDVMGLLGGDYLRQLRLRNWHRIGQKTEQELKDRKVDNPETLEAKHVAPLLEAASGESNETLQDMWARLLANAMDPDCDASLQRVFIDTLKQLEPIDARILSAYLEVDDGNVQATIHIAPKVGLRITEVIISSEHLVSLGCLNNMTRDSLAAATSKTLYTVSALGLELSRACLSPLTP
jgi:hypothetical protein